MTDHELNRRSIRLKEYDYSQAGAYFVTICTHNRVLNLGNIEDGRTILSSFGQIAFKWIGETENHFKNVLIPDWVIMPNHIHMIILQIDDQSQRKGVVPTPQATPFVETGRETQPLRIAGAGPIR